MSSTELLDRIWIPSATALVSFLCYTLIAGQPLTVSKAFTSIALFSQLQGAMMAVPSEIMAMLNGVLTSYLNPMLDVCSAESSLRVHATH